MVHWGHVSVPGDGDEVADDAEGADKEEGEGGRARYRLLGHDLYSMATLNRLLLTDFSSHHNTLGASIYDVRTEGGGGVSPKEDVVREVA